MNNFCKDHTYLLSQTLTFNNFEKLHIKKSSLFFLPCITFLYFSKYNELTAKASHELLTYFRKEEINRERGKNKSARKTTISIFIINEGNKTSRLMKAQVFHLYIFWDKNSFKQQLTSLALFVPLSDCHRWCRNFFFWLIFKLKVMWQQEHYN